MAVSAIVTFTCDECGESLVDDAPYTSRIDVPRGWFRAYRGQMNSRLEGLYCSVACVAARCDDILADDGPKFLEQFERPRRV